MKQKELEQRVQNMSQDEMKNALKEMIDTKYYVAMMKYITYRLEILNRTMWSMDPEDATQHAQVQGIKSGLIDLSHFAELANDQKLAEEEDVDSIAELDEEKTVSGTTSSVVSTLLAPKPNSVVEDEE